MSEPGQRHLWSFREEPSGVRTNTLGTPVTLGLFTLWGQMSPASDLTQIAPMVNCNDTIRFSSGLPAGLCFCLPLLTDCNISAFYES